MTTPATRGPRGPATRLAGLLLIALVARSATASAPTDAVARGYDGIVLTDRTLTVPRPARLLVAQVDLRARGLRVVVSPPSGRRETVRESTLDFLTRQGAALAVNAHFFLPFPSDEVEAWVVGLAAADGRVYSGFEAPEQSFALLPDVPALHIDRRNRARFVHRRGADPRRVRERLSLWNAVSGSAQIVTAGRVTIPTYRDAAHRDGQLTAGPDGRYENGRSWYDLLVPRTVVGLSRHRRTLILAVVDGRSDQRGLTLAELAALLVRDYGAWEALNLDGGGSTSMAWRDPVSGRPTLLNTPTDQAPGGRRVATSLAILARPAAATERRTRR